MRCQLPSARRWLDSYILRTNTRETGKRERPKSDRADLKLAARTCVLLFKAMFHSALNGTAKEQKNGVRELKTVLYRYLEPVLG